METPSGGTERLKVGFIEAQMERCDTPPAKPTPPPDEFKVGDAVRLKAQGKDDPVMTVVGVRTDSQDPLKQYEIYVAYVPTYGGEGKVLRDSFPPAALHRLPGGAGNERGVNGPS